MKKVEIQDQDIAKYILRKNANSLELVCAEDTPTSKKVVDAFCKEISDQQITHVKVGQVTPEGNHFFGVVQTPEGDYTVAIDDSVSNLLIAMQKNGNIRHLDMQMQRPNNHLDVMDVTTASIAGMASLKFCELLRDNPKLEHLDLSWNGLIIHGALSIMAALLKFNNPLSNFNIAGCDLLVDGAYKPLVLFAGESKSLKVLNITDAFVSLPQEQFAAAVKYMASNNHKLTIKIADSSKTQISSKLLNDINKAIDGRLQTVIKEGVPKSGQYWLLKHRVKHSDLSDIILEYAGDTKDTELVVLGVDTPEVEYLNQDAMA